MSKHTKIPKNADRRERWHNHIKAQLSRVIGHDFIVPTEVVKIIEEKEGKTIDLVILDRLCVRRGWGVIEPTVEQANYFTQDTEAEEWPTRCRNRRERDAANDEIMHLLGIGFSCVGEMASGEIAILARDFYRAGDENINQATTRLARWYAIYSKGVNA